MMEMTPLGAKGMLCDPGEHFAGRFEVERKFAAGDLASLRGRIDAMGAKAFALNNIELDLFYDTPDGRLSAGGLQQVVRHMQPSGRVLWIVKGPGTDACVAMELTEFDKACDMLTALGYRETGRLQKRRDIYFLGDFHVTLDNVPGLGGFAEVSVMTDDEAALDGWRERIDALCGRLGFDAAAHETRSYRDMLGV